MGQQTGSSIRGRVILTVFALLLIAVIAAQAQPNQSRSAAMEVSGDILAARDGLLTGRFVSRAAAGILGARRAMVNAGSN